VSDIHAAFPMKKLTTRWDSARNLVVDYRWEKQTKTEKYVREGRMTKMGYGGDHLSLHVGGFW